MKHYHTLPVVATSTLTPTHALHLREEGGFVGLSVSQHTAGYLSVLLMPLMSLVYGGVIRYHDRYHQVTSPKVDWYLLVLTVNIKVRCLR